MGKVKLRDQRAKAAVIEFALPPDEPELGIWYMFRAGGMWRAVMFSQNDGTDEHVRRTLPDVLDVLDAWQYVPPWYWDLAR